MSDGNKGIMIATINYHGSRGMMVAAMVDPCRFVTLAKIHKPHHHHIVYNEARWPACAMIPTCHHNMSTMEIPVHYTMGYMP